MPYIKRGDLITVMSLLLLSLALLIIPLLSKGKGGRVIAVFEGEEYILSLSEDTEREFSNKKGSITLCINDGEAFVSSSTCPDGVCLKSGTLLGLCRPWTVPSGATRTISSGRREPLSIPPGVIQILPSSSLIERLPPEVVVMP